LEQLVVLAESMA